VSSEQETPTPDAALDRCACEFVQFIIDHLKDGRGVHIETAITAAGSMAGSLLLRATGIDLTALTPGSAVLVDRVNESGPHMVGFMAEVCVREGLDPTSGWTGQISDEHRSRVPAIDLARDLYPGFAALAERFGIVGEMQPRIAAAAAIKLVRMGSQALNTELGKAIALWSMLSAAKTVPHHLSA